MLANHWRRDWGLAQEVGHFRTENSVGGTPTDAVETTALPERAANDSGLPLGWWSGGVMAPAGPAAVPFCPPFARSVITEGTVVVKSEVVNGKFRDSGGAAEPQPKGLNHGFQDSTDQKKTFQRSTPKAVGARVAKAPRRQDGKNSLRPCGFALNIP